MLKCKINILVVLIATICKVMHIVRFRFLPIILSDADVPSPHSDEVYSILNLHLHLEDLVLGAFLLSLCWLTDRESEGFLLRGKAIILIWAAFVRNEIDLIATNVGLILVAKFVLILNPNEHNKKPLVKDGMIVEIHCFYNLILLMFVFCHNLDLVLLFQTGFTELFHNLYQSHLHIVIHDC